jgi:DNA transformation protein and related proteins
MDIAGIEEMFAGLGPVTVKSMFGGKGVYFEGLIVGCELDNEMMLKTDALTAPLFEKAGARQWAYDHKNGKAVRMPYWSIPGKARDDPDELKRWTKLAYEAALRGKK